MSRIRITRWTRYNRPHVYRLTLDSDPDYTVLRNTFGYTENVDHASREAIVDDYGNLVLIRKYTQIWHHIEQHHD